MVKNIMPGVDSEVERKAFGQNFRVARMRLDLSQRDVHHLTKIAQSHISEIESGLCNTSVDTMVKLAAIVKIPLWKLFRPRNETQTKSSSGSPEEASAQDRSR